ncbi:MAG: hypothetical protein IPH00_01255 [Flavobacteriales bacterium]|nr:hypothetical protein [Flavobacteriales bacterium]
MVSIGGRSSISLFNGTDSNSPGTGAGGQLRIRLADRVNTDWFYDFFRGPIGDYGHRQDQHIGWSVLFYLRDPGTTRQTVQPYILQGIASTTPCSKPTTTLTTSPNAGAVRHRPA